MLLKQACAFCLLISVCWGQCRNFEGSLCRVRISCEAANTTQLETNGCPQSSFLFPRKSITDYIRVKNAIPIIDELTICAWLTPLSNSKLTGAVVSYATPQSDNSFELYFKDSKTFRTFLNGQYFDLSVTISQKTHLCVIVAKNPRSVKYYINGLAKHTVTPKDSNPIPEGGSFLLGQEQDQMMGGFSSVQSLTGTVENFMVWYDILDDDQIRQLYDDRCSCQDNFAISLSNADIQLEGRVTAQATEDCPAN